MPRSEKFLKEDFVSNLPGGPISEIIYVISVAPVSTRSLMELYDGADISMAGRRRSLDRATD